ncbi:MAG: tRNA pseudouridine(38-40) synthase TruA, partial [Acidimicrobiales bacterium]
LSGGPEGLPAAPSEPLVRVRLTVAYDGANLSGFAAQPNRRTVAGALGQAIEKVVGHAVKLTCAGRTDAGVHAWGQVVHADLAPREPTGEITAPGAPGCSARPGVDPDALALACNRMLAPAIVVREASVAPPGFDARRSALSRRYGYTVLDSTVPHPFLAPTTWQVPGPLDVRAMQAATDSIIGEHDFRAFCRRSPGKAKGDPITRRVLDAGWQGRGNGVLSFEIEAASFCHQMVRSLVGTIVEVGRGRRRASEMVAVLRSGDRSLAASPAPPHGLCLLEVTYAGS